MTGTINETSYRGADESALSVFSTEIALVPILLLIALLVLNEAIHAHRSTSAPKSPTGTYVAIMPLTLVAGFIIAVRLLTIVGKL